MATRFLQSNGFISYFMNISFGPITFFWVWAWLQVQIRLIESYLPWNRGFDEFFGQLLGGQDYYSRRKCLKLRNHGNLCGYDLRTHEGPVRDTSKKYQPFLYADKDSVKKGFFWVIRLRHDNDYAITCHVPKQDNDISFWNYHLSDVNYVISP